MGKSTRRNNYYNEQDKINTESVVEDEVVNPIIEEPISVETFDNINEVIKETEVIEKETIKVEEKKSNKEIVSKAKFKQLTMNNLKPRKSSTIRNIK